MVPVKGAGTPSTGLRRLHAVIVRLCLLAGWLGRTRQCAHHACGGRHLGRRRAGYPHKLADAHGHGRGRRSGSEYQFFPDRSQKRSLLAGLELRFRLRDSLRAYRPPAIAGIALSRLFPNRRNLGLSCACCDADRHLASSTASDDRELLTGLLSPDIRAPDLARRAIQEFGTLPATLSADPDRLTRIIGQKAADRLALVRMACLSCLRTDISDRPLIHSPQALLDYLHTLVAHKAKEEVHIIFLDTAGRLIVDERLSTGLVREVSVPMRKILARALEVSAASAILVHNHPSGDSSPSPADIETTKRLAQALGAINIILHDHVIIAKGGWTSLRGAGLI